MAALDIHRAAWEGDVSALASILEVDDALVSCRDRTLMGDGNTPLHYAAASGSADAVRILIGAGADIAARNSGGATPLFLAAQEGAPSVVRLLLDAGADAASRITGGGRLLCLDVSDCLDCRSMIVAASPGATEPKPPFGVKVSARPSGSISMSWRWSSEESFSASRFEAAFWTSGEDVPPADARIVATEAAAPPFVLAFRPRVLGIPHRAAVRAVTVMGPGEWGVPDDDGWEGTAKAAVPAKPPTAPTGLRALGLRPGTEPGTATCSLAWDLSSADPRGSAISGFDVEQRTVRLGRPRAGAARADDGGPQLPPDWQTVDVLVRSVPAARAEDGAAAPGLAVGATYVFRVAAVNAMGRSAWSEGIVASPAMGGMPAAPLPLRDGGADSGSAMRLVESGTAAAASE